MLSFNTINTLAINVIGGHSKGVKGVEVGGVYNFDAGDVYGTQVAGAVNLVKEDVIGVQVGGVMNGVGKSFSGLQVGGVYNYVREKMSGVQVSGVMQQARDMDGVQVTGVFNQARSATGVQISGVVNNVDTISTVLQIAGVFNRAKNMAGVQIASVLNVADTIRGFQVGLINISNKIERGFSLGLINYSKHGYNKFEIARNDLGTYSIGYRSGWAPLHMFYFGGVNVQNSENRFAQIGGGLGSSIPISKKLNLEFDLTSSSVQKLDDRKNTSFNLVNKTLIAFSWQPLKRFGIRGGVTLNHIWYKPIGSINNYIANSIKNEIYTYEGSSRSHKMWLGWQLGILL